MLLTREDGVCVVEGELDLDLAGHGADHGADNHRQVDELAATS